MTTKILQGHAPDVLMQQPAASVDCAVASFPYLWLRSYGTEPQTWADGWVGELGREPTPEAYVVHCVEVANAVRHVLKPWGTFWVNLAGNYYREPGGQNGAGGTVSAKATEANRQSGRQKRAKHPYFKVGDYIDTPGMFRDAMLRDGWYRGIEFTLVKKSPMPDSVDGTHHERCRVRSARSERATAAVYTGAAHGAPQSAPRGPASNYATPVTDGWEDCPGCAKCSETDGYVQSWGSGRPTMATEKLYVFAKNARYYYDSEAVRVQLAAATLDDGRMERGKRGTAGEYGAANGNCGYSVGGRNLWNWLVWEVENFQGQHYAAYPRFIPRLAIQAGTSDAGNCPACGKPWARVIEQGDPDMSRPQTKRAVELAERGGLTSAHLAAIRAVGATDVGRGAATQDGTGKNAADVAALASEAKTVLGGYYREFLLTTPRTIGWRPTCPVSCHQGRAAVPATVLDPTCGSGTTPLEANAQGRHGIGVELQPTYVAIANKRLATEPLSLFAQEGAAG